MYRLTLYYLIVILLVACILSVFKILPYSPVLFVLSTLFLVFFSSFLNTLFSAIFDVPANVESVYITALILALIVPPATSVKEYFFFGWIALLSTASKYLFTPTKKHIFNPAAIAVIITSFGFNGIATWWIGNISLFPFVFIGGLLIIRKIRREQLFLTFIGTVLLTTLITSVMKGSNIFSVFERLVFHSSVWFLGFVMLTEPLTTPPTLMLQRIYAVIVGILFVPDVHLGNLFFTPELALCLGNIYSYLVSPKTKEVLRLKEKIKTSIDTFDFLFPTPQHFTFTPGQYMEWTIPHPSSDDRGNRRYFTLASSPTEKDVRLGVKFYDPSSSYKKAMISLTEKTPVLAAQVAGDFTLPNDTTKKLVFIAGGIGITPFRSMLKYLIDKNEKRDIILFYSNKNESEITYQDILTTASKLLGIRVVYILTAQETPIQGTYEKERINEQMLKKYINDVKDCTYYISGPHAMVTACEKILSTAGIHRSAIVTDYFPGF